MIIMLPGLIRQGKNKLSLAFLGVFFWRIGELQTGIDDIDNMGNYLMWDGVSYRIGL